MHTGDLPTLVCRYERRRYSLLGRVLPILLLAYANFLRPLVIAVVQKASLNIPLHNLRNLKLYAEISAPSYLNRTHDTFNKPTGLEWQRHFDV